MSEGKKFVTLGGNIKVTLHDWPLRPGVRHLDSVRLMFIKLIEFKDRVDTNGLGDVQLLKDFDLSKLTDEELDRFIALAADGCDIDKVQIENLHPAQFIHLCVSVAAHNVHPVKGLRDQLTSFIAQFTSQPRK